MSRSIAHSPLPCSQLRVLPLPCGKAHVALCPRLSWYKSAGSVHMATTCFTLVVFSMPRSRMNLLLFPTFCEEERSPGCFLSKEWLVLSGVQFLCILSSLMGFKLFCLSLCFFLAYPPCSLCWGQSDNLCDFLYPKWKLKILSVLLQKDPIGLYSHQQVMQVWLLLSF